MDAKMRYEVRLTKFHTSEEGSPYSASSRVVSCHYELKQAIVSAKSEAVSDCRCGCTVVVDTESGESISPWTLGEDR